MRQFFTEGVLLTASSLGSLNLNELVDRFKAKEPGAFKPGDRVLARNIHPLGHTRLPRYARGKRGVIERDHGVFVFPDTNGMGLGEKPQHCYSVRFTLRELWGPGASRRDSVHIDLWDDHLEPV